MKGFNTFLLLTSCIVCIKTVDTVTKIIHCDVIIAGGSTASLGAAINAARKGSEYGYEVCLTEPTDWLGGQLTSSAVSAIDFGKWNRYSWFQSQTFVDMMNSLGPGNPGRCWVSTKCYLPRDLLGNFINKTLASFENLRVFFNTVIKSVERNGHLIESVTAVQRFERQNVNQWSYPFSETIQDWYDPTESQLFTKQLLQFKRMEHGSPVIVEGTELGDILVLSNAAFRQGVEIPTEDSNEVNDLCGQRFTIPFYLKFDLNSSAEDPTPDRRHGSYSLGNKLWGQIWSYRRSKGVSGKMFHEAHVGEISNQNWADGNDFYDKSLLLNVKDANTQISDWKGGIDVNSLKLAESRSYGWYYFFKK